MMLCAGAASAEAPPVAGQANEPVEPPEMVAAQGHWKAGAAYFRSGELRRALREFLEAQRDVDRPELAFNIALTYERLGDYPRAVDFYQRYLDRAGSGDEKRALTERVTELRRQIGKLVVTSATPGAVYRIDEERLTPDELAHGVALTAGDHRLVASKEGYLSRTLEVTVVGGQTTQVSLDPSSTAKKSRWWIGVLVGSLAAVGIAAGVTAGVLLSKPVERAPFEGNANPPLITVGK
jgi:hypothetical protein